MHPSGQVDLPEELDAAAVAAVKAAWSGRRGWYKPDSAATYVPGETLSDIAGYAGASIKRDGDRITFGHDDEGDPKWSEQATAFYVAIAPFVLTGAVHIEGEDGGRWSYTYADGQLTQQGCNGWDGTGEPFGEPDPNA
ncbi:hypothetical protein Cme02nite_48620 [Catellatospora methionotrophica]|uniref:Uncharacterized protein n=1 Tax=Catellatospora methionotrophica TaxID=121620 RepID=A0A8J3LPI9_9ACTN|nr:hypothetical protein Cme02nite_48620 [Catellatospora methionotrophica]